jgi:hypothetical protein
MYEYPLKLCLVILPNISRIRNVFTKLLMVSKFVEVNTVIKSVQDLKKWTLTITSVNVPENVKKLSNKTFIGL